MTVRELFAQVDAVTAADARRVIQQHFPLENLMFTLIAKASEIAPLAKKYATDIQTKSRARPSARKRWVKMGEMGTSLSCAIFSRRCRLGQRHGSLRS